MGGGSDKTEEATPKKREDSRKKGQVAKSMDLQGAVVLLAGLAVLSMTGPAAAERMGRSLRASIAAAAQPQSLTVEAVQPLMLDAGMSIGLIVLPIGAACAIASLAIGWAQVGLKPMPGAAKPQMQRLNPLQGAKNVFGPNMLVEGVKSVSKVAIVGAIVFAFVAPRLQELGASVGMSPVELGSALASDIKSIAFRAAAAYFVIGVADFAYQRHRNNKSMKMDLQEVKEEHKGQELPAEVRSMIRRRQMQGARARMMEAVPEADVVVVNPTHYAVALKYDGTKGAPEVVAKGQDLIALKIRELAESAGVPIVQDVPLARSLHASVEVDQEIPEDLYQAVAAVLAWVYRTRRAPRAA